MSDAVNDDDWEARLDAAWARLDDQAPGDFVMAIDALAGERRDGDGAAAFERASARDSTGRTAEAVPLYRAALEAGLTGIRRRRATIQLASSLGALGRAEESLALLLPELDAPSDALDDAVRGFLALVLVSLGREREAASHALEALARHLPRYNGSLARYARTLRD